MKHLQSYNTFILEYSKGSRTEKVSLDELVEIFNENCSDWDLDSEKQIWRGSYTAHQTFYVNPAKHEWRYTANASGFYQALLPHLKSWQKAPRRDKSLIMATDEMTASQFGDDNVFLMVPFNNVEIGMCACSDLWCSNKFMKEITGSKYISWEDIDHEFFDFLQQNAPDKYVEIKDSHTGKDYSVKRRRFKPYTILREKILEIIEHVNNIPKEELKTNWSYEVDDPYETINIWLNKYPQMSLLEFLEMFFDFDKNGFKIVNKQSQLELDKEVWSSGEFIGIHKDLVYDFKKMVKLSRT
jgi:hypothetical protein